MPKCSTPTCNRHVADAIEDQFVSNNKLRSAHGLVEWCDWDLLTQIIFAEGVFGTKTTHADPMPIWEADARRSAALAKKPEAPVCTDCGRTWSPVGSPPGPVVFTADGKPLCRPCVEQRACSEKAKPVPQCRDCGTPLPMLMNNGCGWLCDPCVQKRARIARLNATVKVGDVIRDGADKLRSVSGFAPVGIGVLTGELGDQWFTPWGEITAVFKKQEP